MRLLVFIGSLLCVAQGEHGLEKLKVKEKDFENTNVEKVCLIAELNAAFTVSYLIDGETVSENITIPQDASTEGSFCNINYVSDLRIGFHGNVLRMIFLREQATLSVPKKISYCDHCDYGTWALSELKTKLEIDSYELHASISTDLGKYAHELTEGIDLKRAFRCNESDRLIVIPLHIDRVMNSSSHEEISTDWWRANVTFHFIQIQPFLVLNERFNDPYLCKDVRLSHFLVITVPIVYFIFFILFYRIKSVHGCPSRKPKSPKAKKMSVEMEESTNILSGEFSTVQMGLTSSTGQF